MTCVDGAVGQVRSEERSGRRSDRVPTEFKLQAILPHFERSLTYEGG
jgi:hypothetical protein